MELELLFKEEKEDIISEWDKLVPIVSRGTIVTAYLMSEVYETEEYNELCYTLEHTQADEVRLIINNGGGLMHSMLTIRESINKSNATVTAVLSGIVASAATMITLACDKIEVAPHTSWLTHYYSGGNIGKGNEIDAKHKFDKVEIPKMFKAIHKDFLTVNEIKRVIDGKDIWLNSNEVIERFNKMKAAK